MSHSDTNALRHLISNHEWKFIAHNENPFEYANMSREEFADCVLAIMGNSKLSAEEKTEGIDQLLSQVKHEAALYLMEKKLERGWSPEAEEREWAEDQKHRGRNGL